MEIVEFGKEILQSMAEQVASYKMGQSALRHLDRALWVVEKCARWAVPPPLDIDERPQPELVRPLPWIFFLMLLITLRVTRESISIINLFMGKPPLRSADVVMYIQSKRRYLRTLKYQGNRMMRARSAAPTTDSWHSRLRALMDGAMCFRGTYGNNNTMRHSNNDEVLVVKRSKRGRQTSSPIASTGESTMERLIERMMVDLDADSDDSSFTLTNVTSVRSDRSDTTESEQDTVKDPAHSPNTPEVGDSNTKDQNDDDKAEEDQQIKTENKPNGQNENISKVDGGQDTKTQSSEKPLSQTGDDKNGAVEGQNTKSENSEPYNQNNENKSKDNESKYSQNEDKNVEENQDTKTESLNKTYSRSEDNKVEEIQEIKTETIQNPEDAALIPPAGDTNRTPREESQTLLNAERNPFFSRVRKVANGQVPKSTKRGDQSEDLRGSQP